MRVHAVAINRREFLKRSSILGLGSLSALASERTISAASKNRVVVFQGVGLDSLHPYAYSGGGISGIWQHVIEPLIEMDFSRNEYIGVLAESWEYQGKKVDFSFAQKSSLSRRLAADLQGCALFHRSYDQRSEEPASVQFCRGDGYRSIQRLHCDDHDQTTQRGLARTLE